MTLAPGTRLGQYEVLAPLGAGGMGEVYRARDTRLDRSVAIKSLPAGLASDRDRLARFEREARLLAALNHPNIAGIHGIEDIGGAPHLVLEFVEGETLAQRLARGPLTIDETLDIAGQIAAGLDAAHERGIVHRDLKPGNIMLTPARTVKVLDFGLAKDGADAGAPQDLSVSPTRATSATDAGLILGTAPYMSPEQARGRTVDKRADVWAFACVVYECLTSRQAFAGETVSDVIARIIEREPDWNALPAAIPPRLRDLLRRCLTKSADDRPRDIGDLRRELAAIALERSSPGAVAGAAGTPSLAVLYFENLAADAENEYFCAGITEDILTDLSKIKRLRVASRNAVARYRGQVTDIGRVAADLGVAAVLEGSVRRSGDRVRITAQLISADGFHLWAERYDRRLEDVFAVQEEIASSIAQALSVALTAEDTERLARDRPSDVQAYDLYLKGREEYRKYDRDAMQRALELFQRAVAVDPGYAHAWAGIADVHGQMLQYAWAPDPEQTGRVGLEAARRAIALDPKLPEGHKAEALVLKFCGDMDGARAALKRAVEVDPRFTPALINLLGELFVSADVAGAERMARRVLELDPQQGFALSWLGYILASTGRAEESLAMSERLRRLSDEPFYVSAAHIHRGWIALGRGDIAEAERVVAEARAEGATEPHVVSIEALIAARSGRSAEASQKLASIQEATLDSGGLMVAALAAVTIGNLDRAVQFLSRPVFEDGAPVAIRLEPGLHPLLDRPPFAPRRMEATLIWPLEAPMIETARFAAFREVRIESARPQASDLTPRP